MEQLSLTRIPDYIWLVKFLISERFTQADITEQELAMDAPDYGCT
jgi:hypothetical protein